jgi:hypothetical protein
MPAVVDDPTGLTSSWLTDVLAAAGVDAAVTAVSVHRMGTGQMASCYRVRPTYGRGDGPASLVAKLPSPDPKVRAGSALTYRCEVGFYRDVARDVGIDVPRCMFAACNDDGTAFTLLLEDLGDARVGDQLDGCTVEEAHAAVAQIARLHAETWDDVTAHRFDWLIPPATAAASVTATWLPTRVDPFVGRRELDAATVDVLRTFADGYEHWALDRSEPSSMVHSDFRLDNLLFAPPGTAGRTVTTVDWASVVIAQPLRDVAFLVGTGMEPEVRRRCERDVVASYHAALLAGGVADYGVDRCWDDYRHGLFHGPYICLMAESLAAPSERGLAMFTTMAERSAAAIRDLDCLDLLEP